MNDTPPAPEQVVPPLADPASGKDTPQPVDWLGEIRSLAVMLLAVLAFQVGSGLVINNEDNGFSGPLYASAPGWLSDLAGRYHKDLGQWLLLTLVALQWVLRGLHQQRLLHHQPLQRLLRLPRQLLQQRVQSRLLPRLPP